MPHECVSCGEVFEDGADEVFDGCPDCGATKFFYVKEVTDEEPTHEPHDTRDGAPSDIDTLPDVGVDMDPEADADLDPDDDPSERRSNSTTIRPEKETPVDPTDVPTQTARGTEADTNTDTDTHTGVDVETDDDIVEADSEYEDSFGGSLDSETETEADTTNSDAPSVTTDSEGRKFRRARPDEARRRLLNEFETIRIVEPGSYELNLMNLYEDEEKIIALQEDGKYQVSLPSTIGDD